MTEEERQKKAESLIADKFMRGYALPVLTRAFEKRWAKGWDNIEGFPDKGKIEEKAEFAWKFLLKACPQNKTAFEKILSWHVRQGFLPEDVPRLSQALDAFERKKRRLPEGQQDISDYKTHRELYDAVKKLEPRPIALDFTREEVQSRFSERALKTVWSSDDAVLMHVRTKAAAQAVGENTEWCTARTGEENAFDSYKDDLLILWTEQNHRTQIHLRTSSWKDEDDEQVNLAELLEDHPGLDRALLPYLDKAFSKSIPDHDLMNVCETNSAWKEYLKQKGLRKLGPQLINRVAGLDEDNVYAVADCIDGIGKIPEGKKYCVSELVPEILEILRGRLNGADGQGDGDLEKIDDENSKEFRSASFKLLTRLAKERAYHSSIEDIIFPALPHLKCDDLGVASRFYSLMLPVADRSPLFRETLLPAALETMKKTCFAKKEKRAGALWEETANASRKDYEIACLNSLLKNLYDRPSCREIAVDFIDDLTFEPEPECDQQRIIDWVLDVSTPLIEGSPKDEDPHPYRDEVVARIPLFLKLKGEKSRLVERALDQGCPVDACSLAEALAEDFDGDKVKVEWRGEIFYQPRWKNRVLQYAKEAGYLEEMKPVVQDYITLDEEAHPRMLDYRDRFRFIDSLECPAWSAAITEAFPTLLKRHGDKSSPTFTQLHASVYGNAEREKALQEFVKSRAKDYPLYGLNVGLCREWGPEISHYLPPAFADDCLSDVAFLGGRNRYGDRNVKTLRDFLKRNQVQSWGCAPSREIVLQAWKGYDKEEGKEYLLEIAGDYLSNPADIAAVVPDVLASMASPGEFISSLIREAIPLLGKPVWRDTFSDQQVQDLYEYAWKMQSPELFQAVLPLALKNDDVAKNVPARLNLLMREGKPFVASEFMRAALNQPEIPHHIPPETVVTVMDAEYKRDLQYGITEHSGLKAAWEIVAKIPTFREAVARDADPHMKAFLGIITYKEVHEEQERRWCSKGTSTAPRIDN